MARIDDYIQAKNLAAESLLNTSVDKIGNMAGYENCSESILVVPFLDRKYKIDFKTFDFTDVDNESEDVPIQEQVLILHYLNSESFPEPSENWVAYREIPGAAFYHSSFLKRAVNPLINVFGANSDGLNKAAKKLDGTSLKTGDASFEFHPFPKIPVRITLWVGDEEFEPEANIVFDRSIEKMLSPEDIAWMAGMVVYRLMALSR
jgi:hypothetical protein